MRFELQGMSIGLTPNAALNIDDASGVTLRVVRGRVWVTQEGCVDDVFLDAGAGHTFRRPGRVVVSAERALDGAATVLFDAPLAVVAREPIGRYLKRLLTIAPAPRSIAGNAYEGL
jgi:hypothetical protein